MKPRDILILQNGDKDSRNWRIWEVQGVYLGCVGQESLIELKNLTELPGVPGRTGNAVTTFVPEPLLRSLTFYTPEKSNE